MFRENSGDTASIPLYFAVILVFLFFSLSLSYSLATFPVYPQQRGHSFLLGWSFTFPEFRWTSCYKSADEGGERMALVALRGIFDRTINGAKRSFFSLRKSSSRGIVSPAGYSTIVSSLSPWSGECLPALRQRDGSTRYFNYCKSAPSLFAATGEQFPQLRARCRFKSNKAFRSPN